METMNGNARPESQGTGIPGPIPDSIAGGGRKAPRPNPEVAARAKRRTCTGEYKRQVLAEADAAKGAGGIGAVLRRNGLYSSHLTKWRHERATGILEGLTPHRRGPKAKTDSRTLELQQLQRENDRLTEQLRKAEIVIDVQKKVAALLGRILPPTETL